MAGAMPRQGILSLAIKDQGALYNAYMPFVQNGGLFVPTTKKYSIGDEVFLLLSLVEEGERLPVAGKVIWVTPSGASGNRQSGIGVQFASGSDGDMARSKIENLLAQKLNAERPTHTM